ncbi:MULTISPECIES: 3-dehydro-L-gulonate-6-phosphate decarboxylase [unclassified Lactobacillus]|uniref:3-dehydro-L-gulonate-6-phosphate decarboxylase n=1 Tax=unclassified Lactobacillus TaxID=2620435 RepID=UPI000EFC9F8D|nr:MULTISPECIES: 3-dehydro-L-gulonate-6-phosphate decarboxylase [unclassified Lactobacillus]RMC25750.1 3-dehydro-L-gulonate-6-phosphate decarboxylase [Lactobacillus sp. ESL0247]RMC29562.1 3-dehydro-L-gulonate-6-phosphate decarboxylase [Lactobacillus sp. ESL0246]RMC33551.1 3-dehydro-L-gulonate-6-phosphate decarboxylase [Lactobacillus sp. ESL0245]
MDLPMLQVALDCNNTAEAINVLRQVKDVIDVVETGTILVYRDGLSAVSNLRAMAPDKIVLADVKCADAGEKCGKSCKEAGADWMTCINAATVPTMSNAQKEIEVQVELYEGWDNESKMRQWLDHGIQQVVYHQSRDAKFAGQKWSEKDVENVKNLIKMGFKVSVTGGVHPEILQLFKGVPVYTFIAGRDIREAEDPHAEAMKFKKEINRIWG